MELNSVYFGDCREGLRKMREAGLTAQTCVTSPPYFGLRDYGHPGQIGLEETPEQYIAAMVEVFRGVRDVLADDGTVWLNIGDSYAGTGKSGGGKQGEKWQEYGMDVTGPNGGKWNPPPRGLKQKDLIGIPWMLAFALRADGWYLRQDIIWHKPNPMPESVTDRCTKAHEYIFLLSKSARYYFDSESVKERAEYPEGPGNKRPTKAANADGLGKFAVHANLHKIGERETRNKRSVWTVATKPYSGAHFATFPPELIQPCIQAGSRIGDTVLDPFMGSGTTAQVAQQLGRNWLGCELNPEYSNLQRERVAQQALAI